MQAKKSLGQNFLVNDTIIQKIVSLFNCNEKDLIIEIGPGRGALTKYLANKGCKLICIEIDKDMQEYLNKYNAEIIYENILNVNIQDLLKNYSYNNLYIIGNLPYYITSPIIDKVIKSNVKASKMIFMVQEEVANRFSSHPGNKEYGYMTIFINHYYDVKYEFMVAKNNFNPIPKVDSAIISLNPKDFKPLDDEFWEFLKKCFSHKRKKLKNNLGNYNIESIEEVLQEHGYNSSARAEELPEEIFIELYEKCKGE